MPRFEMECDPQRSVIRGSLRDKTHVLEVVVRKSAVLEVRAIVDAPSVELRKAYSQHPLHSTVRSSNIGLVISLERFGGSRPRARKGNLFSLEYDYVVPPLLVNESAARFVLLMGEVLQPGSFGQVIGAYQAGSPLEPRWSDLFRGEGHRVTYFSFPGLGTVSWRCATDNHEAMLSVARLSVGEPKGDRIVVNRESLYRVAAPWPLEEPRLPNSLNSWRPAVQALLEGLACTVDDCPGGHYARTL